MLVKVVPGDKIEPAGVPGPKPCLQPKPLLQGVLVNHAGEGGARRQNRTGRRPGAETVSAAQAVVARPARESCWCRRCPETESNRPASRGRNRVCSQSHCC